MDFFKRLFTTGNNGAEGEKETPEGSDLKNDCPAPILEQGDAERAFGMTHPGRIRKNNEDFFLADPQKDVYIVADGMGGHLAGEVASQNATESVDRFFSEKRMDAIRMDEEQIQASMRASLVEAHRLIQEMGAQDKSRRGMGCTIVMGLIAGETLHLCHVGDARAYIANAAGIHLATTDHSVVMAMVGAGRMTMEEARNSPFKNEITMAIGGGAPLIPEYARHPLCPGDRVLLCSDGLWDMLSDARILEVLTQPGLSAKDICHQLVKEANEAGGRDNITVLVIMHRSAR
jgi:protein phosphatase